MVQPAWVRISEDDFVLADEYRLLCEQSASVGAVATFSGLVRDINEGDTVTSLFLEHYPGMTEKTIERIATEAAQRWSIQACRVIHRVGLLHPGDQIVFVGVASQHRGDAFRACEFIMDFLKTEAPFWKKEVLPDGDNRWLDARKSDREEIEKWR